MSGSDKQGLFGRRAYFAACVFAAVLLFAADGTAQTALKADQELCSLTTAALAENPPVRPVTPKPSMFESSEKTARRSCTLDFIDNEYGYRNAHATIVEYINRDFWLPGKNGYIERKLKGYPKVEGIGDIAVAELTHSNKNWIIYVARGCYQISVIAQFSNLVPASTAADIERARALAVAIDQRLRSFPQCPGQQEEASERLPVIFLPGVAGTILTNSVGHELWPLAPVSHRANLAFEADGVTSATGEQIKVGDMLRRPGMNFYGGFMEMLENNEYKEGTDLFAFPYDWRLDNASHFARLDQLIDLALKKSNKKKVILTAHSMGGVIARGYIYSSPQRAEKVSTLITMGTPYWGAPKVYYGISSGYQFGNPTVRQELMKVLLQNMAAAYQLLPQIPFITDKKTGQLISLDQANTIKYKWFTKNTLDLLRDSYDETKDNEVGFSKSMLEKAKAFYTRVGTRDQPRSLPAGVKQYAIIGTGVATVNGFEMEDWSPSFLASVMGWKTYVELGDGRKVVMHPITGDGDGTVPLWSLETAASTANYYVSHDSSNSAAHGDLPANPKVQAIALSIIQNKPPNAQDHPRPQQYFDKPIKPGAEVEDNTQFELHSDAHLRITNGSGKALGFNANGGIDESLPGTFLSYEGVEYASVSDLNNPLSISVDGIRTGKFTLNIKTRKGGKRVSEFQFEEVPVVKGTKTNFAFTPATTTAPPKLSVTNGATKTSVAAKVILSTPTAAAGPLPDAISPNIPSIGGYVTSLRFFESDGDLPPPLALRQYTTQFSGATLRVVYFELSIRFENSTNEKTFIITSTWRKDQANAPFARQNLPFTKPADFNIATRAYGHGNRDPGLWEPGTYIVDIIVNNAKIATGTFLVN